MASTVHKILDSFGTEDWLMYGSVCGAIRYQGPLPWDNDVDIGFRGSGTFALMTFDEFIEPFAAKGLKVYYKRWITNNVMKVYSEDLSHIKVDLFALYDYNGWMKRAGLETWILALNYNLHDTFPAGLVENPLPEVRFGGIMMPARREGIEIQKYLYRDDWWMEVKPITCGKTLHNSDPPMKELSVVPEIVCFNFLVHRLSAEATVIPIILLWYNKT